MKPTSLFHGVYLPTCFHLDLSSGCSRFKQPPTLMLCGNKMTTLREAKVYAGSA